MTTMLRKWAALMPLIGVSAALTACATSGTRGLSSEEKAALYINAAAGAMSDGQPVTALQDLAQAEKIAPKMPEIFHTRALVYVKKGEFPQAIAAAKRAVELNPKYSAAQTTLGKLLMDQGHPDEAIEHLKAAAADDLYPEAYKPLTSLGILYYRKMDLKQAGLYFDKAVAADPRGACVAYYYRGHIHLHQGEFRQAIHDYDQATRRFCAGFAEAHLALAIAYERDKQYDSARKKYLEIKDHFSNTSVAEQAMSHLKYLP
jgi:Tfp pilus assembly protein PilF